MSDEKDDQLAPERSKTEPVRKPYQKPAFVHEQVFETMALACGKVNPTSGQCRTVRKNS